MSMTPTVQFKAVHVMDFEGLEGMTACRAPTGILPRPKRRGYCEHRPSLRLVIKEMNYARCQSPSDSHNPRIDSFQFHRRVATATSHGVLFFLIPSSSRCHPV